MTTGEDLNVLVVHDGRRGPSATQMISFGQPFEVAEGTAPARIAFQEHCDEAAEIERAFYAGDADLLVLSRYTSEKGQQWLGLAHQAGIPVVFHIDDDLLAVPESLGEAKFKIYNDPGRLAALRANIEGSDLLYVSTAELGRRFCEYRLHPRIVAGEIYCSVGLDDIGARLPPATGPVMGYMGTSGHSADLAMIMPAICNVMDSIPALQFEVFGTIEMPAEMKRFGSRARHIAPLADYREFRMKLRSLGWWVGLAPLEDNQFNRCKADTKWVEYSLAGIAVVASDLAVYHRACADGAGLLAATSEDWSDALRKLILRPDHRHRTIREAQAKLGRTYTHECLRSQTLRVFEQALQAKGAPAA